MKTFARTLLALLIVLFFFTSPVNALAAVLERVSSQTENGRDVVSLQFDGRSEPKIFSLPGDAPRLVFDFTGARYLGPPRVATDGALVKAVRIATHQNPLKTRVVFDLAPGSHVDYHQEFLEDSHTLRISLSDKNGTPAVQPTQPTQPLVPQPPATPAKTEPPAEPPTEPPQAALPPVKEATVTPSPVAPETAKTKPPVAPVTPDTDKASEAASPFDGPPLTTKLPAKAISPTAPAEVGVPPAARLSGYSLVTQPSGGDVLRLQLDGYASPKITAREGSKPQIVCFFPRMRLALKKGQNQPPAGRFVEKVTVSAQKEPVGVQVVLDLESGYDYDIQQVFVKDELAFLLVVNVFDH